MLKYTMGINSNLHDRLIDRGVETLNGTKDKAPGRVDEIISLCSTKDSAGTLALIYLVGKKLS